MHYQSVSLSGIKALTRPISAVIAAIFVAGSLFNPRIADVFKGEVPAYVQTHTGEYCLLESPLRWQQGGGISKMVLLPAGVSLVRVPTASQLLVALPTAVLPSVRKPLPHLRGPPLS